jgi:1-acyl-sn-glycerol-3-phosphate acyltransferase
MPDSFRRSLYAGRLLIAFVLAMPGVVLAHVFSIGLEERRRLRFLYRVNQAWMAVFQALGGLRWRVHHLDRLEADQTYVFVCNHVNLMDIPIVGGSVIHPWRSLAKQDILRIPVLGWIIGNISIMVDRSSRQSRNESVGRMIDALERGVSVMVFPEGTRNRTPQPLQPFYPGAFTVAIAAQVPIVPMLITNSYQLCSDRPLRFWPGRAHLTALEPISTQGLSEADIPVLAQRVHRYMLAELMQREARWASYSAAEAISMMK